MPPLGGVQLSKEKESGCLHYWLKSPDWPVFDVTNRMPFHFFFLLELMLHICLLLKIKDFKKICT